MNPNQISDDEPKEEWLRSKLKIIKNQFIIGLAWIFQFTAYQSIANLQSSLNSSEGLGTASLSTIYVALVLSSLFVPPIMIRKLGLKWTIVVSQATYTLFIASNIYPSWYTSIPTAVILGFGASPLWTSKCAFLTETAGYYARISMESAEAVVNRFFGLFFMMFQTSQIWGNIISSTILKPNIDPNHTVVQNISLCGSRDRPGGESSQIIKPKLSTVYLLCGLYVAAAILAMFIIIFFLDTYKRKSSNQNEVSSLSLLFATFKHMKNPYQIFLIPMTFWLGFQQAFLGADYTKSYVACSIGINHVGLTMICYGIVDALCSIGFGQLMKYTGRLPIILFGAVVHYTLLLVLLLWHPNSDQIYVLYLLPVCYGVCDAVWQTQINAIYGVIFKGNEDAAFSNFRLWESLGFAISYAYSSFIGVSLKLYLLLGYLTLSMIGYLLVEITLRRKQYNTEELLVNQNKI